LGKTSDDGGIPQFSEQGKKGDFDIVWEDGGAKEQMIGVGLVVQDRQVCYEGKTILSFDELPKTPAAHLTGKSHPGLRADYPRNPFKFSSASLSDDKKLLAFVIEIGVDHTNWWGIKNLVSGKISEGGIRTSGGLESPVFSPQGDKILFQDNGSSGSGMRSLDGFDLDTFKPLKINEFTGNLFGQELESFDPRWISNETIGYKTRKYIENDHRLVVPVTSWVFDLNTGEAHLYTASIDEIAKWKTYRNEKYGFELKYPSDWNIVNYPPSVLTYGIAFQAQNESGFKIYIKKVPAIQTLKQYLLKGDQNNQTAYEGSPSKAVVSSKKIIVSGLSAIQRTETWYAAGFTTVVTYVKKGNAIYFLQLQVNSSGNYTDKDQETYNLILSTFKLN
jgi:hypothetical protein